MEAFYTGLGLRFMEKLVQSATYAELFYELPGSKLKIQSDSHGRLETARTGYRGLQVASSGQREVVAQRDPDGLDFRLVPRGHNGVTSLGFSVAVPDAKRYRRFLAEGMDAYDNEYGARVGDTQFFIEESREMGRSTPICRKGFTYITLIVHDLYAAQESLLAAGAAASFGITRLHDRCVFSFVEDPFGNWIEVVQYANLSGPLPDVRPIEDHLDEVVRWREEGIPF
jgi:catechol 2,3-dioxygenase-like lactoylglutathione lyase family enzyme